MKYTLCLFLFVGICGCSKSSDAETTAETNKNETNIVPKDSMLTSNSHKAGI